MKTNKFIENSTKELLDRLKESFANKNVEYKESGQIDIEVLTNATEKYNKLCEELDILNSYKTIFGIN